MLSDLGIFSVALWLKPHAPLLYKMSKEAGFDQNLTVFSPEGRLYQIEYAFEAVAQSRITSIVLRCSDGVVMLSTLPTFDRLQDASNVTYVYKLNDKCQAMVAGRLADGQALIHKARSQAYNFFNTYGYQATADIVAELLADTQQVLTQEASKRIYGAMLFVAGWDDERNEPLLYRVDPAGACLGVKGAAAGFRAVEITASLAENKGEFGTCEQALRLGLKLLQKNISSGLTGDDIEAWMGSQQLTKMSSIDLDNILEKIKIE